MSAWKTRVTAALPRAAIVFHDLFMVWLCWMGLNQFRYSMEIVSLDLPFWSPEVLLILCAQGLVFWKVGLYRGRLALREPAGPAEYPQGQPCSACWRSCWRCSSTTA